MARARNDALLPLWKASGALYPCIYLTGQFPPETQKDYLSSNVAEAVRCAKFAANHSATAEAKAAPIPVLPYQWSYYHNSLDGKYGDGLKALTPESQPWPFELSYDAGAAGVVMWDCPAACACNTVQLFVSTRLLTLRWLGAVHRVNATRKLIDEQVGPLALSVIQRAAACAAEHCSDHGRCASLGGNVRDGGRTGGGALTPPACVCDDGWSGAQCGQHT